MLAMDKVFPFRFSQVDCHRHNVTCDDKSQLIGCAHYAQQYEVKNDECQVLVEFFPVAVFVSFLMKYFRLFATVFILSNLTFGTVPLWAEKGNRRSPVVKVVEQVGPSVVNINTEKEATAQATRSGIGCAGSGVGPLLVAAAADTPWVKSGEDPCKTT